MPRMQPAGVCLDLGPWSSRIIGAWCAPALILGAEGDPKGILLGSETQHSRVFVRAAENRDKNGLPG